MYACIIKNFNFEYACIHPYSIQSVDSKHATLFTSANNLHCTSAYFPWSGRSTGD